MVEQTIENTYTKFNSECKELKSIIQPIKHNTSKTNIKSYKSTTTNLDDLTKFLEDEKSNNITEPWSKLDKTTKIKKLLIYAENYKEEHNLSNEEHENLILFLRECLDKKKLQRVKDVNYDKTTGKIKSIPALIFNKLNNHFTLKNIDKRVSTTKSLAPKKNQKTIKNITTNIDSDNETNDDNDN
jgi:hypothetical protein